jgi:uncharacterized protein (UPF0332 family)
MKASRREMVELWHRAQEALRATHTLLEMGFPDFAAARAYYAAFYAASALLLAEGKTFRSHRGVVALIHRDYVRSGRLPLDMGRVLSTLSDLRSVGDYGGASHGLPRHPEEHRLRDCKLQELRSVHLGDELEVVSRSIEGPD